MEVAEFEEFFRAVYPRLTRYARRSVDPSTAEELAAAALQTLWEKNLPAPKDEVEHRKLRSLAYRIVEGKIRNERRAAGKRAQDQQYVRRNRIAWAASDGRAYEDGGLHGESEDGLPAWVESLPRTDRAVLALVVDGFKGAEIAEILDCSRAAVTMRLQRAKKRARVLWSEGVDREQPT